VVTISYDITFINILSKWWQFHMILHLYTYRQIWLHLATILYLHLIPYYIFTYIAWLVTFWYHITFLHISLDWLHFDIILHFYIYRWIGYILISYYIFTYIVWLATFWYHVTFLHISFDWLHFDTILHFYIYRLIGYILILYYIFTYIVILGYSVILYYINTGATVIMIV
jgi:hypothetical protein